MCAVSARGAVLCDVAGTAEPERASDSRRSGRARAGSLTSAFAHCCFFLFVFSLGNWSRYEKARLKSKCLRLSVADILFCSLPRA